MNPAIKVITIGFTFGEFLLLEGRDDLNAQCRITYPRLFLGKCPTFFEPSRVYLDAECRSTRPVYPYSPGSPEKAGGIFERAVCVDSWYFRRSSGCWTRFGP